MTPDENEMPEDAFTGKDGFYRRWTARPLPPLEPPRPTRRNNMEELWIILGTIAISIVVLVVVIVWVL